jgi:hypothetical protein
MQEARYEARQAKTGRYLLTWRATNGQASSCEANGIDISSSGIGVECSVELKTGAIVYVEGRAGFARRECEVVHCARRGATFRVGLEFRHELTTTTKPPASRHPADHEQDYYEVLQINRKADLQTIHRVFRIMAARFHPDNPQTGDVEQFLRMKQAYTVLSDSERRREYDASLDEGAEAGGPRAIFQMRDFVTGVEAEANRRLGVLCLLYTRRQTNPDHPGVSLLDLEKEMGFPREYLSFTIWYLRSKDFITIADNSDYALTADGADFIEEKAARSEIAARLLTRGSLHGQPAASPPSSRREGPTPLHRVSR